MSDGLPSTIIASMHANQQHLPKLGSDRHFGLVFSLVFLIVALWPLGRRMGWSMAWFSAEAADLIRFWALWVSAVFLLAAWIRPAVLHPLNRIWFRIGLLLGRIVSPVVLGVVYLTTVVPTGLIMRALGKDLLRLRRDEGAETYWIDRPDGGVGGGHHAGRDAERDAGRHSMRNPY